MNVVEEDGRECIDEAVRERGRIVEARWENEMSVFESEWRMPIEHSTGRGVDVSVCVRGSDV